MSDDVKLTGEEDQPQLFETPPDWADMWRGMPEYRQDDLLPWQTVLVHFERVKDREAFAALVGQSIGSSTKFIWYPKAKITRAADKVYTRAEKVVPRHPVYIISKGRWESRLTQKCLEWIQVPYHICVEPQEYAQYAAVIDPTKIFTLPFSNLGQGGIPARNWVWDHAISIGAERHWILDDNIDGFCRFQDNLKVEVDSGVTFKAVEDFVDRYENIALAGFNYDYFAPRKQGSKIKPVTLNTRIYSGILIKNDLTTKSNGSPIRWRGRYNEDTDLSLCVLKDGWATVLFNAFLMYKRPTLTMKGGNTDELYKRAEDVAERYTAHVVACKAGCRDDVGPRCDEGRSILSEDGRWLMAESLREQHPDCVSVVWKWDRWQHQVDYSAVKDNTLILKPDAVIPNTDTYAMELAPMPSDADDGYQRASSSQRITRASDDLPPPAVSALAFAIGARRTAELATGPVAAVPSPPEPIPSLPTSSPLATATELSSQPSVASAREFRDALLARGHRVLTRDGKLFVSEASRLTDDDRATWKLLRAEMFALAEPWTDLPPPDPNQSKPQQSTFGESLFQQASPTNGGSLAEFLGTTSPRVETDWRPDEPPDLTGIDGIVLNFATDGLEWTKGARPIGVTVSTLDGQLTRFLPFRFRYGGNLDEAVVKRWALEQLKGKKIINAKTKFDIHMAREWGVDLEEQGCTFSDIQHTVALLDDSRGKFRKDGLKPFALDTLALDYLPDLQSVVRVDESQHANYHASEVVAREKFTAELVWRLRDVMYPQLDEQDLRRVQTLEDDVIPAVVEMERNGSPIDVELLEQYCRECNQKHDELMLEISQECGFAFEHTATGWKRLIESLHLAVPDSFSEGILNEVDHPLIRKGQRASQYASLNSKIFKAYPEHIVDGILRYSINQLASDEGGTVSGRFSIGLVQQVPNADNHGAIFGDELFPRRLFIPGSGDYLEGDAAQIEFRLLVHYSENAKLLQAYRDDPWMSFHKKMQEMLVTYKPDMLYAHTKNYNFAAQYGARSIKLAIMMGFITERQGDEIRQARRWNDPRLKTIKEIEEAYKHAHPEAGALLDRASHLAKPACDEYCKTGDALHRQYQHRGYVKTFLGRRSRFSTNFKTYIGLNRVLQGTGASVMKKKLTELHAVRKETGFVMRITNHDAVLGDATTPETLEKVSTILNRQSFPFKVPILWKCGTGRNWAECK